jgi:hypothetical protein
MKWAALLLCLLFAGCAGESTSEPLDSSGEALQHGEECPGQEILVDWSHSVNGQVASGGYNFTLPANGTIKIESTVGPNYGDSTWRLSVSSKDETYWLYENGGGAIVVGRDNNIHGPQTLVLTDEFYLFAYEIEGFIEDIGTTITFTGCP